jgi:hypothetical protein
MSDLAKAIRQIIQMPLVDRLFQDEIWVSWEGQNGSRTLLPIGLEEMSQRHRENVMTVLISKSASLKYQYEKNLIEGPQPRGDAASDAYDAAMQQLWDQDPEEWMEATPLYKRLAELENAEG